ncbi:MAG TPA: DUF1501 domain-containing protein [Verrucomicrobiota bacterium]|nr:DUF1501 domain-containing protein [Verrucomicrobiales bacterium]HRI16093.1 DUF1501 domain-containing protein [Verrucomicrobiota bacterium]
MKNTSPWHRRRASAPVNRREFLWRSGGGLGGVALASMFGRDGLLAATANSVASSALIYPPRAKRVVQFFMAGAASHVDMWDYKPLLEKQHGQKWDPGESVELFQDGLGSTFASPWKFRPYGQSGKMLSEIVAPIGSVVDEIAFIHNLVGKTGVHSQATLLQATGFNTPGFPGMGCWVSYGLGSLNENLPTFVVMPDLRGYPSNGAKNWDSAFLSGQHQGTVVRVGSENPIEDLFPPRSAEFITSASEQAGLDVLERLNEQHATERPGDARLEARIRSYELAARMQLAAPEALDLSKESPTMLKLYGIDQSTKKWPAEINVPEETDIMGRKCLTARRLLERGVRFIQIWSGNDNSFPRRNWDSHEDIARDHGPLSLGMAKPVAALIMDLKQRGLLDDTIVLWTTEFGRMPCAQSGKGRDHNPFVFTNWLCGGGIKGGVSHGPSDEWGYKPANRNTPTQVYDIHATILRLLGIEHTQLTVRHNGIDRRLTDVHGESIKEIVT